jgi:exoribonuclease R
MSEEPQSLEQRLMALISGPNYRPMKPRMIAKRFDLDADQRVELRRMVKKLVRTGKLTYGKNHFILPPSGTAVAKLRKPKTGAGEGPPPTAAEQAPETETAELNDTLLDEDATDDEAPEVAIEAPPREKPRKEKYSGEKSKPGIVGTFRRTSKGFGFVRPLKTSVAAGRDLDIFVAAEDSADAASGDVVRVRVSTERNRTRNSQGRDHGAANPPLRRHLF